MSRPAVGETDPRRARGNVLDSALGVIQPVRNLGRPDPVRQQPEHLAFAVIELCAAWRPVRGYSRGLGRDAGFVRQGKGRLELQSLGWHQQRAQLGSRQFDAAQV